LTLFAHVTLKESKRNQITLLPYCRAQITLLNTFYEVICNCKGMFKVTICIIYSWLLIEKKCGKQCWNCCFITEVSV